TIKEFYSIDVLDDAIEQTTLDAYILDWIVDNKTVLNTIKKIRSSGNKHAMVMVITGQLSGAVDSEISRDINELDIIG
ncbi:hypothetical protein Q6274_29340, partial [Klebsiella pneumoniae]|nr:hypothetical protein [Klebsiella pneumoniae]